jgi:peptide/nickel transport system substrate-binding protein
MKTKGLLMVISCLILALVVLLFEGVWAQTKTTAGPKPGGILKIGTPISPVNLGYPPILNKENDHQMTRPCLETLITFGEKGTIEPGLATSWEVSPDQKSVTFRLRKDVKFHDGTNFNAEAAKFNLDLQKDAKRAELKNVERVELIDDYTIRVVLTQWDCILISSLGYHSGLMASPTAIKTKGKDWVNTHPVGTGPFKFVSMDRDVSIRFEKFENYWQKGKPYLDGIEWVFITDPMTALAAFKRREVDVITGIDPKDAKALKDAGIYIFEQVPYQLYGFVGDSANQDSPFADVRVRRALNYAIDKEAIASRLGYGFYEATDQPSSKYSLFYNPKVVGYPYNPQAAKKLLSEAGYPNGFKSKLYCPVAPQSLVDAFIAAQGYFKQVGIDVEVVKLEMGAIFKMIVGGSWNGLMEVEHGRQTPDDLRTLRNAYFSTSVLWKSMLRPKAVDIAIENASKAADFETQVKWVHEANRLITDEYCLVTLVYLSKAVAVGHPYVRDLGLFKIVQPQFMAADAWLNK